MPSLFLRFLGVCGTSGLRSSSPSIYFRAGAIRSAFEGKNVKGDGQTSLRLVGMVSNVSMDFQEVDDIDLMCG